MKQVKINFHKKKNFPKSASKKENSFNIAFVFH